jgi:hypothetical protein
MAGTGCAEAAAAESDAGAGGGAGVSSGRALDTAWDRVADAATHNEPQWHHKQCHVSKQVRD